MRAHEIEDLLARVAVALGGQGLVTIVRPDGSWIASDDRRTFWACADGGPVRIGGWDRHTPPAEWTSEAEKLERLLRGDQP